MYAINIQDLFHSGHTHTDQVYDLRKKVIKAYLKGRRTGAEQCYCSTYSETEGPPLVFYKLSLLDR